MLKTIAASGGSKALEKLVTDLYDGATGAAKRKIARWRATSKISSLHRKLFAIRKVRTIWDTENAKDLFTFYYPTYVTTSHGRSKVTKIDDLVKTKRRLVLQGTVGQGKSILLRFLSATEIFSGTRIPLFVELRYLNESTTLEAFLLLTLRSFGFGDDKSIFDFLAESGKLALCLDGFDEVKESRRASLIFEIEQLCTEHDSLITLITSRPDNGIEKSNLFEVIKLEPLRPQDVNGVIQKLTGDEIFTKEICDAISGADHTIRSLITTPLMATLLAIAYKAEEKIPSTLVDFYESLFNTLLFRHDKLKKKFERTRTTKLSDRMFRNCFDALCFLARKKQALALKANEMEDLCDEAIELSHVVTKSTSFLKDVSTITCLILREGDSYHFLHKSISEYHCASFIRNRPLDSAKRFYDSILKSHYYRWSQDLEFLKVLDAVRFAKLFVLPGADKLEQHTGGDLESRAYRAFINVCNATTMSSSSKGHSKYIQYKATGCWLADQMLEDLTSAMLTLDWQKADPGVTTTQSDTGQAAVDTEINVGLVLGSGSSSLTDAIKEICKTLSKKVDHEYSKTQLFVLNAEEKESRAFDGIEI